LLPATTEAAKGFTGFSAQEIPRRFPSTAGTNHAQQQACSGFEKASQVASEFADIAHAVDRTEVRDSAVERAISAQAQDFFGGHKAQLDGCCGGWESSNLLSRDPQHLRRPVTGNDIDAMLGKKTGVHTCPAADVKDSVSRTKALPKFPPNGGALQLANDR
jgi:hypothetical protein